MPQFSIIIPLFNRPAEIDELLHSLTMQSERDFEVIIVEDGSTIPSREVVAGYDKQLSIQYLTKSNSGPALSRNFGATLASGEWLIFLDSDCVAPPDYLAQVKKVTGGFLVTSDKGQVTGDERQVTSDFLVTSDKGQVTSALIVEPSLVTGHLSPNSLESPKSLVTCPLSLESLVPCHLSPKSLESQLDFFGGPDAADDSFSPIQKAINYSMTSFFTTGGIRGGAKSMEKFHPRSFNMGIKADAFAKVGGFGAMRFGEDVDLSMRLFEAGYKCALISDAWVYHKRRVDFRKFYRQVKASGGARIELTKRHRGSLKLVHLLPAAFLVFVAMSVVGAIFCPYALIPLGFYMAVIGIDCSVKTKNLGVGAIAIAASLIQLCGYGIGFFGALMGSNPDKIKNKKFYK